MIRFGPEHPPKRRQLGPRPSRLWSLVVMLGMTLGMMAVLAVQSQRAGPWLDLIQDKSGTGVVAAEEAEMATDEEEWTEQTEPVLDAVELDRLVGYNDHSRNIASEPYYYLLDLARRNAAEHMEELGRRDLTWSHLFRSSRGDDPDRYRGQLILLRGRLRRLIEDDAGENEHGLTKRYEGWLYTEEAGRFPYVVVVTDPPAGMPLGSINEAVSVAGYYLGWWRYETQEEKLHAAPVILGRRFVWHQTPIARPDSGWGSTYGLAIGVAIAVICLAAAFLTFRRQGSTGTARATEDRDSSVVFDDRPPDRP